jgi:tetratricopeptide (TPR) repeat protein
MIKKVFLFSIFVFLHAFVFAGERDSLKIRDCYVPLPEWWNEVQITLPNSVTSLDLLKSYCEPFKKDTSAEKKIFIKSMLLGLQKLNIFSAYAGDAYFDIGKYDEAISIYKKIIPCTANEKGRSDEWKCYLYYMTGKCYEAKKDKENALTWYRLAIAPQFEKGNEATVARYKKALCAYRCLMNIQCDY